MDKDYMEELHQIREEITSKIEDFSTEEIVNYINNLANISRERTGLVLRNTIADKSTAS